MTDEGYNPLDKYYLKYRHKIAEQLEKVESKKYVIMIDTIRLKNQILLKKINRTG